MARDGVFFKRAGHLNAAKVPAWGPRAAGNLGWRADPRAHVQPGDGHYGNSTNLLDYVISAALIFYILTILGIFRLRRAWPDATALQGHRLPVVPALYVLGAGTVLLVLFAYRTATPGLVS